MILQTPVSNATSRRINLWSARHSGGEQRPSSTGTSVSSNDQGQSRVLVSSRESGDDLRVLKDGYHGAYSYLEPRKKTVTALNSNKRKAW